MSQEPAQDVRALADELLRARHELERAERRARSFLARQGLLDQTRIDVVDALQRLEEPAPARSPV
ncbi:MAG: hypothetical protein ACXVZO_10505 [Gaiellaceae bacterium]